MFNDIVIGPITIHMYGVMIAAGFLAALLMTLRRGKKRGYDEDIIWGIFFCAIIGGMLGTRDHEGSVYPLGFQERLCGLWRNHRRNSGKLYLLPHEKAGVYAVF